MNDLTQVFMNKMKDLEKIVEKGPEGNPEFKRKFNELKKSYRGLWETRNPEGKELEEVFYSMFTVFSRWGIKYQELLNDT